MRKTRVVRIGRIRIGGGSPVAVQSMCNTQTSDVKATVRQIRQLEKAGCEIVRVSVPDRQSAAALKEIRRHVKIPLVADIHFDARLAVAAAPYVDKLRINPGNMSLGGLTSVVESAKRFSIPIRIGVNSGSIEKDLLAKYGHSPKAMVESVRRSVKRLESLGYKDIVISAKMSDVPSTIEVYQRISRQYDYPLHIGVTEAGTLLDGSIKSSLGMGILLSQGIGDTIRVSLTENPVKEVEVGFRILQFLGLRLTKREVISCPTCSRTKVDLIRIAKEIEKRTENMKVPIRIAVMGCVVNGPGEARNADVGIACGDHQGVIFRHGKVIRTVRESALVEELMKEIRALSMMVSCR